MKAKDFMLQYRHAVVALYFPLYMVWFMALEKRTHVNFTNIHCIVDDWIPFCEYFIVPYMLWFFYVLGTMVFFFLQLNDIKNFYHTATVLVAGMTICLIIYTLFPNGQNMRPVVFARDDVFTRVIAALYHTDTATNVLPSLHVYNSLAIHAGICRCRAFEQKTWIRISSLVLCILICLSTMFLKQHSFLDFITAALLFVLIESLVKIIPYFKEPS